MNVHELTLQNYSAASGCPSACQPMLYLGTAGSYGNEQINVVLGEGWQGLTVKAVFQPAGVTVLVPGDGTFDVPWEATETALDAAKGRIVFEGVTDGRVLISTDIPYAVGSHSDTEGSNSQPPTPSQWEQFVDEVKGDADRAEQAAKDAEVSVQTVKDAGAQAVTDIGNAKDSALEAIAAAREEAVGSISADVEGAKQAAADAEQSAADAEQSAKNAADALANVQSAGQSALDDIATERQNTLSDIQNEGAKQQSAVAGAGTAALEAIGQTEQAAINQIKQTGATQVGAVQSAGTTQVGLVNSAGQQQTENIAQAGSQQVQAVQAAGTAAVGAVNDARDEAVEEIETANAHSPQINQDTGYWQTWNAETGEYVDTTTKAQGPQGETGATPQLTIGTVTTLDPGEDATVTITGTAEAPVLNFGIPKGEQGDGSTSGSDLPATTAADSGKVPTVKADGSAYELAGPYAPLSAAIRPTSSGNPVSITDSVEWPLQGLKVYGKSVQDGTPSPENPVPIVSAGDGGSIGLTVSNSADQNQQITISTPTGLLGIPADGLGDIINYTDNTGHKWYCDDVNCGSEITSRIVKIIFDGSQDERIDRVANSLQTAPVFLLKIEKSIFIPNNIDCLSNQFKAQHTFDTNNIIQNHCMWTRSTYFGNAVAIRADEFTSAEEFRRHLSSSPLELLVNRATPITTHLSSDELAAYRALHTYDGATVVSTAEDVAGLEVRYVADAQKYIDNRLTVAESHIQEIAAAQLNAQTGG